MATHCNGDHVQFYQCHWSTAPQVSGIRGYAVKYGDTIVRVISARGAQAQVCIASLDGCQNLDYYVGDNRLNDVEVQRYQTGVRVSRPSTGWAVWNDQAVIGNANSYMNAYINAPNMRSDTNNDICLGKTTYPSINWVALDVGATPDYDAVLFTAEDAKTWCDTCHWLSATECKHPPKLPDPPTPKEECKTNSVKYEDAEKCCEAVEGDPELYKDCLFDYCLEGENDVCIGYQLVEGSSGRPICLTERATDACPKPPGDVCANSAKLDLTNVVQNNLEESGGAIRYGQAGTINGKVVDVVVTAAEGYKPYGVSNNGNAGEFGTINVQCGTEAKLTFTIVQTGTDKPEAIEQATLSYYDLDEGKRAKGRMTVETCDQDETVLAENTELTQVVAGNCVAVTSSKKGSAKDNPTSLMELDDIQRARAVTYSFSKLSSWTSTVSLATGSGGRGFMFSMRPAEACRPEVNLVALGWVPPKPGDKVVPEDRKNCTVGGCPWGKGCCMDKSHWIAQSWARPNRRIRDTCLSIGFHWCTMGNKQQSKEFIEQRDGGLKFAVSPPMTFLMEVGLFTIEKGGERPRLLKPVRVGAAQVDCPDVITKAERTQDWSESVDELKSKCLLNDKCKGYWMGEKGRGTILLPGKRTWRTGKPNAGVQYACAVTEPPFCTEGVVADAEWVKPFRKKRDVATKKCKETTNCKGIWQNARKQWAILVPGKRLWKTGSPNKSVTFVCATR